MLRLGKSRTPLALTDGSESMRNTASSFGRDRDRDRDRSVNNREALPFLSSSQQSRFEPPPQYHHSTTPSQQHYQSQRPPFLSTSHQSQPHPAFSPSGGRDGSRAVDSTSPQCL